MTTFYKRKAIQLFCFIICLSLAACSAPSNLPKDNQPNVALNNPSNDISTQTKKTESSPSPSAKSTQTQPQIVIDKELQKWSSPQSQFTVSEGTSKLNLTIKNKSKDTITFTLTQIHSNEVYALQEVPPNNTMSISVTRPLPIGEYNMLWRAQGKAVTAHVKGKLYYQ